MKAILVIDMPYYCCTCPFFRFKYRDDYDSKETVCTINGYVNENGIDTIASWCPLKPLPEKLHVEANRIEDVMPSEFDMDKLILKIQLDTDKLFAFGWNKCLEELEK